ncbi:hypothetical protein [Capnocytophaga sp.]|uniref:hypothetical protein n=1 Tax=Capnocytophaga sp. TaxID=44737 RepID=UPI0026DBBE36|nr:hypothetical protein [Capnocytophaga sp.]MDO5104975.1 hypothetical protein [Capnocytophaga sp.]
MKFLKIVFLGYILCLFTNCVPDSDYYKKDTLRIVNNSNKDIYFSMRGKEPIFYDYPPSMDNLISANGFIEGRDTFRRSFLKGATPLYLWIFDREVIETIPWEQVKQNNMYLRRYDLTLEYLDAINWKIVYDGN